MKNKTILVIEDNALVSLGTVEQLKEMGYSKIHTAMNVEDAKTTFSDFVPDIILMDIGLEEDIDGVDLANIFIGLYEKTPCFIFISAYTDKETQARITNLENSFFIEKPFEKSKLEAVLSSCKCNG